MEEQTSIVANEIAQEVGPTSNEEMQQIISSAETIEAPTAKAQAVEYAGFWVRFAALMVDGLILFILSIIVSAIFGKNLGTFLQYALMWTYAIYMLSTRQATFGKMALGLKVTTVDGGKSSTGKLALREIIGKVILNTLTLGIGYIMVAFTEKKQGLHDMVSDTVVVYDPTRKRRPWLVVTGVILALGIPVAGIFAGVILVSLNSARNKAYDNATKAYMKAVTPSFLAYADAQNNSFVGYKLSSDIKFPSCTGNPIVNISPDGKNIAIFAKSCSDENKYYCNDKNGLTEVSPDLVKNGNASCE